MWFCVEPGVKLDTCRSPPTWDILELYGFSSWELLSEDAFFIKEGGALQALGRCWQVIAGLASKEVETCGPGVSSTGPASHSLPQLCCLGKKSTNIRAIEYHLAVTSVYSWAKRSCLKRLINVIKDKHLAGEKAVIQKLACRGGTVGSELLLHHKPERAMREAACWGRSFVILSTWAQEKIKETGSGC